MPQKKPNTTIDIDVATPEEAMTVLRDRGYDTAAIYSFACAARSWCKKGEADWLMWKAVEALSSSVPVKPS